MTHAGFTPKVAASIEAIVHAAGGHVPRLLGPIELRLAELATGHGPVLGEHAGATIAAGGKRLRPLLVLLAAGEFAAATVGFGARNFSDLELGLGEMARVVRPGGKVVVLEITTPTRPPLSTFYRLWFDRVVPVIGRLAGDPEAYEYLPSSVRRFPAPRELAAVMDRCGLDVRYVLTAGGIIALHVGTRRAAA